MRDVFDVYLAKADSPGDEAYATLSLPAGPYEIMDALEKVRPDGPNDVDLAVEEYHDFGYLAPYILPHPDLYGLNALAERLSKLNEYEATAFHGLVIMEAGKVDGQLPLQRLLNLAYSADCCHVVADALNDSQLGRFYADNGFVPEVENLSDEAYDLLNFEQIGRKMRKGEDTLERRPEVAQVEVRTDHLLAEGTASMDAFHTALRLRAYLLAKGNSSQRFIQTIPAADHIAPEVFQEYADEALQGTGRVVAALDIDLDRNKFSTLSALNGWESYTTRDVSTAAWRVSQKNGLKRERRLEVFAAHLDGKEITPEHRLDVSQITFADEIMEMDGLLNFYVATDFDPDSAFGTHVCTDENDDWVNVYANYDMVKGQVCGALEVNLCRGNGTEKTMRYHLSAAEKKVLTAKMKAFCQAVTGLSLKDYCAQLQAEDMGPSAGQTMG